MSTKTLDNDFSGKTVVITGASGGIGRSAALRFAASGATIFLHANRNVEEVTSLSKEIRDTGRRTEIFEADFSRSGEADRFLQAVFRKTESVDVWINGAGVDLMALSGDHLSFEQKMQKIFEVDVFAAVHLSREVGRRMLEQNGGTIFFFGWNGVHFGWKSENAQIYGCAKGAILGFSRSLAECLAPDVRICCLSLGWIETRWGKKTSDDLYARIQNDSRMNRWGTPEDVAETILFLAGRGGSYVDGIDLRLDGGKKGAR